MTTVSAPRRRTLRVPRPRPIWLACAIATLALVGGAFLWLRDSWLVAVNRVTITGVSGPDAQQITQALRRNAMTMTTLDVQMSQLRMAVEPYPVVKGLDVSTQFPHGMRIHVTEQIPVGTVALGGRNIAVAGDGTLLHDMVNVSSLPEIVLPVAPGGSRVSDPNGLNAVALLAAAPYALLLRISQVSTEPGHGLVAALKNGPSIYFGDLTRLRAKWLAAMAVLSDHASSGATYIDVNDPGRPAAGAPLDPSLKTAAGAGAASPAAPTPAVATPGAPPPATPTPALATPAG